MKAKKRHKESKSVMFTSPLVGLWSPPHKISDILVDIMDEYPTESDIKAVKTLITYCKNMLLTDEEIERLGNNEGIKLLDIYGRYNAYLRQIRLMVYDDQMIYAYRMLKSSEDLLKMYRNRYRYICVDEAQDTSKIQHLIIGMLAGRYPNIMAFMDGICRFR